MGRRCGRRRALGLLGRRGSGAGLLAWARGGGGGRIGLGARFG